MSVDRSYVKEDENLKITEIVSVETILTAEDLDKKIAYHKKQEQLYNDKAAEHKALYEELETKKTDLKI